MFQVKACTCSGSESENLASQKATIERYVTCRRAGTDVSLINLVYKTSNCRERASNQKLKSAAASEGPS